VARNTTTSTTLQTPPVSGSGQGKVIPFRQATLERVEILAAENAVTFVSAGVNRIERVIEGTGFMYGVLLDIVSSGGSGATTSAVYYEDAPFSVLDTCILRDNNGELVDVSGFSLAVAQFANAQYRNDPVWLAPGTDLVGLPLQGSNIENLGDIQGNFRTQLWVPVGINRRTLVGILGNQDRAAKYSLRTDVAAGTASTTGPIFTTIPSGGVLPTLTINKFYHSYTVPMPTSPTGIQQQMLPPSFGTLHFTTQNISETAPSAGSTVTHYVRKLGRTIRWMALVFRSVQSSGPAKRGNVEGVSAGVVAVPSNIRVKFGDDAQFNESWQHRRVLMYERYGRQAFGGVLVYDNIHDFGPYAGNEMGADYLNTQSLSQAQFDIAYPNTNSQWAAGSSLTFVTDELLYSRPAVANG
jgi:hypothetical protein